MVSKGSLLEFGPQPDGEKSDRWYSCTSYDRQQFDQKYPGQRLNDLLRYGEPDWPDKPREGREWQEDQAERE